MLEATGVWGAVYQYSLVHGGQGKDEGWPLNQEGNETIELYGNHIKAALCIPSPGPLIIPYYMERESPGKWHVIVVVDGHGDRDSSDSD